MDSAAPDNSNSIEDVHLAEVINIIAEACIDYPEMPFDLIMFFDEVRRKIGNETISQKNIEEYIARYPGGKSTDNITHFWQVKSLNILLVAFNKMEAYNIKFDDILKIVNEADETE